MYYLTGFADEAANDMAGQIRATRELGWSNIESRGVNGKNIHDIGDAEFESVCAQLEEAGVGINCFGSAIANWGKSILEPGESSLEETRRAIPRMRRLGAALIRIMSFAVLPGRDPESQMAEERFARLRELVAMFADAGITPVHENCMNYGGMGWEYTLRLLDNVPGLKLVFDTGNPVFTPVYRRWHELVRAPHEEDPRGRLPRQSAWEFYEHVREHIAYVHVKDGKWHAAEQRCEFTMPGEGEGDVERILGDLLARGYAGGISIEPHLAVVQHEQERRGDAEIRYANYVEYGKRLMRLLERVGAAEPAGR